MRKSFTLPPKDVWDCTFVSPAACNRSRAYRHASKIGLRRKAYSQVHQNRTRAEWA